MQSDSQEQSNCISPTVPPDPPLRTGQSYLERLGVLYHDQIRLAIVSELNMREMSPKQFFEQVGGTSYASVRRHFLKLVAHGWLRWVRSSERNRRGRPEQLYRSTELAVIDDETWAEIPMSVRDAFTARLVDEMGDWLAKSWAAGTFDARSDSCLSFTSMTLDDTGLSQAFETLNGCFRSLSQEQADAKVRLNRFGEPPILMIVELGGFEIPRSAGRASTPLPPASPTLGAPPWPPRIAKVFADPLNLAIIKVLNESAMSPTELHGVLGGASVAALDHRCKTLTKLGWVAKVDALTGGLRRGATENFYQATCPDLNEAAILNRVPAAARTGEAWENFQIFCESAVGAIKAGTFNARDDRHLSMCRLLVDETGWGQVIAVLRSCDKALARIEYEAGHRLKVSTKKSGKRKVGLLIAGFVSPVGELPYR